MNSMTPHHPDPVTLRDPPPAANGHQHDRGGPVGRGATVTEGEGRPPADRPPEVMNSFPPRQPTRRRQFLHSMGALLVTMPFLPSAGCARSPVAGAADGGTSGGGGADLGGADLRHGAADSGVIVSDGGLVNGWSTRGTAGLAASYPDPFAEGLGSTCALYRASTLGPCHALTVDRQDLSEGLPGLPVRLVLLVVDTKCQPVPLASVEVWHAAPGGVYSGADAARMCTNGDSAALAGRFFRGVRTAGQEGRVVFDTCYPGWYPGRTVHVHFTVRVGAAEYLTSQVFFDDALSEEIIATQPLYRDRGPKDTSNASDRVVKESGLTEHLLHTQKMPDGALLAWKALAIQA